MNPLQSEGRTRRDSRRVACGVLAASLAVALLVDGARAVAPLSIVPTFDGSIAGDPNAVAIEGTIDAAIRIYDATSSRPSPAP